MAVKPLPQVSESGHQDANQVYSAIGVQGTLGTADTAGTAPTVAFSGDPTTGAQYVYNLGPAGSVSLGNTPGGTINRIGSIDTIGTMPAISLALNTGTITTIAAGTQNTLGTVGTVPGIGTITNLGSVSNAGTVKEVGNIAAGTLTAVSSLSEVVKGTITLIPNVTTVANLTNGSVNILTGTLQSSGTTTGVGVVSNLTNGSVNILTGTIQSSGNGTIVGGTIGNLNAGTIQRSSIPVQLGTPLVTVGTTGAAVWGTLVAASGAGTKQYVARTSIVVQSGTVDVAVTNIGIGGSTGAGVLERGQFVQGGGITNNYDPVMVSGTNGTLSYWLGGAGTVAITVNYWQGV